MLLSGSSYVFGFLFNCFADSITRQRTKTFFIAVEKISHSPANSFRRRLLACLMSSECVAHVLYISLKNENQYPIELSNAYKNFRPFYILERLNFLYALLERASLVSPVVHLLCVKKRYRLQRYLEVVMFPCSVKYSL